MKISRKNHKPRSNQPSDILRHYLEDISYGANDGIITTFAIISGVQGAKLAPFIVLILGFVNLFADGISMGASRYLSIRAGSSAHALNRGYIEPIFHALVTFFAFFIFGLIPLFSFIIPTLAQHQFIISCVLTALSLFTVGSLRIFISRKNWLQGGIEMLILGSAVASIAYFVGFIVKGLV